MNLKRRSKLYLSVVAAAAVSGCTVSLTPVAPPPPAVTVAVGVPEAYVWDGVEFVGEYNGRYMYLNGGVWVECDEVRLGRFHGWERGHPEWRRNAIHNYRYLQREERRGEPGRGRPAEKRKEEKR